MEMQAALPEAPSCSAVCSVLHLLAAKGHARREEQGKRYIYLPAQPRPQEAIRSLEKRILELETELTEIKKCL